MVLLWSPSPVLFVVLGCRKFTKPESWLRAEIQSMECRAPVSLGSVCVFRRMVVAEAAVGVFLKEAGK
jgi:hypothetical protein